MIAWILLPIAGGLGAYGRYRADLAMKGMLAKRGWLPLRGTSSGMKSTAGSWPILVINVLGSFAAGLLVGPLMGSGGAWLVVGTGLLGGWTTFSTAMDDVFVILTHPATSAIRSGTPFVGGPQPGGGSAAAPRFRGLLPAALIAFGGMLACVLAAIAGILITGA
ncbi:MAG: CrcB family protein [Actinomycetaceae bacterium]|nr:CrcB family protein [Actinomycetaceae bacterium]